MYLSLHERRDILNSEQNKHSLNNGQVIAVYKERYVVESDFKKINMEVSGRFKFVNYKKSDYPQIGDYVKFRMADEYLGIIENVVDRISILEREDVGNLHEKHILATNIDLVFICMSLNEDFNVRKLRNYLSLTYDSNFETIILLTKKDLCNNSDDFVEIVKSVTDCQILTISSFDQEDLDLIQTIINKNTAVFIGSSGVGKSTIINHLIGEEHFKTSQIRLSDAQGRHTTVNRELIQLKSGGKVIDTPGIRIVSSYFVSEEAFEDIQSLSEECYFSDCKHIQEPGCMVQKAISDGELDTERFEQYLKVMKLNAFHKQRELERTRMFERKNKKGR